MPNYVLFIKLLAITFTYSLLGVYVTAGAIRRFQFVAERGKCYEEVTEPSSLAIFKKQNGITRLLNFTAYAAPPT